MTVPVRAVERLSTRSDVVAASGDDIFVRSSLPLAPDVTAWQIGGGVAWFSRSRRRAGAGWLTVVAGPRLVPALAGAASTEMGDAISGVTVPAAGLSLLPAQLRPVEYDLWDWFSTASPPPLQPGEAAVRWAGPGDHAAIVALLDGDSPRHSARPGEPNVRRWCVLLGSGADSLAGADGATAAVLACAAQLEYVPGVPHLASIVTRSDHRGRGLGAAISAWLTRQILADGAPRVTLGMYADNDAARRLYHRLGYADSHHWASGRFLNLGPPSAGGAPTTIRGQVRGIASPGGAYT